MNGDWVPILGYMASGLVLATFCMNTMIPLRVTAIVSNVVFFSYGALAGLYPVMVLHVILFPLNIYKLYQLKQMTKRLHQAERADLPIDDLMPFLREVRRKAGDMLFHQGDLAQGLYYIAKGSVDIVEVGVTCQAGNVIGEMGIFSTSRHRTASARCREDCLLYELSATKAKELYFQNPAFGFGVLSLIVNRLIENVEHASQTDIANPASHPEGR